MSMIVVNAKEGKVLRSDMGESGTSLIREQGLSRFYE